MRKKILVVDDSPTIQTTVGWLLSNAGYQTKIAHDGLTALSLLKGFTPDLIVLDIRLKQIDGYELCMLIRNDPTYAATPIVMLSGLTNDSAIQKSYDVGAADFLPKPVSDQKLVDTIHRHLSDIQHHL